MTGRQQQLHFCVDTEQFRLSAFDTEESEYIYTSTVIPPSLIANHNAYV